MRGGGSLFLNVYDIKFQPQNYTVNFAYKQHDQQVMVCDIEYIEADGWLCKICTSHNEFICAKRLKQLYALLQEYSFIRCHKGYIVNMAKIAKITSTKIFLISGTAVPLGRTYKNSVRSIFEKII